MELDLNKGIYLQIEGELGKFKTLPVEYLVKIASKLQTLILNIARYDLEGDETIDLNNFKIELAGFFPGSAVPEFILTPRINYTVSDVSRQRQKVNERFMELIEIASKGDYYELKNIYPDSLRCNVFTETLYEFANSAGGSPMSLVKKENNTFKPVYKIHHFKNEIKTKLITTIEEGIISEEPQTNYAKILTSRTPSGRLKNKVIKPIHSENASLAFSPENIQFGEKVYRLHAPLHCKVDTEYGYYVIQNDILGIVGTGDTFKEAVTSFSEDFDFIVNHYRELDEQQMSSRIKRAKEFIRLILKA